MGNEKATALLDSNLLVTVKLLVVWLVERIAELACLSFLLSFAFDGAGGLGVSDLLLEVLFFYVATGYVFSTILFGLFKRRKDVLSQSLVMMLVFLAHLCVLLALGNLDQPFVARIAVSGVCIVAFVNLLGEGVLRLLGFPTDRLRRDPPLELIP